MARSAGGLAKPESDVSGVHMCVCSKGERLVYRIVSSSAMQCNSSAKQMLMLSSAEAVKP